MLQTNRASQRELQTSGIAYLKYCVVCLKPNSTGRAQFSILKELIFLTSY